MVAVRVVLFRKFVASAWPSINTTAELSNSMPATVMTLTTSLTIEFGVIDITVGAANAGTGMSAINSATNSERGTKRENSFFMGISFLESRRVEWLPMRRIDIRL